MKLQCAISGIGKLKKVTTFTLTFLPLAFKNLKLPAFACYKILVVKELEIKQTMFQRSKFNISRHDGSQRKLDGVLFSFSGVLVSGKGGEKAHPPEFPLRLKQT